MIGREFHRFPWELEEAPMDDYLELLELLSVEAELMETYPPKGTKG